MATTSQPATDMLLKLEQVRKACLLESSQYLQVVPGIVPILQSATAVNVRRWGADFVAEAFASPALPGTQKEQLISDDVLALLRGMLETPGEDGAVVKSAIQAAASMYPYVFRKVISYPDLALVWRDMTAIKINVLQRMDTAPLPIRIGCIKFLQKVVQVQTPGVISDPRRPEHNETSIALVPRNHPLLPLVSIEAETSGVLDRLLAVLQENSTNPLLVDPTMNCLAVLIKTRPAISAKILQTVLSYNPLKSAAGPLTSRTVVVVKSLQRTTKALLRFVRRILPSHPLTERIDIYLQRLQSSTTAVFSQAQSLKRSAEPSNSVDNTKRQKLDQPKGYPPIGPPPHSYAQLFTLIDNAEFQQFDVKQLPEEMVCLISSALMQHIDSKSLDLAIEEVQQRWQGIQEAAKVIAPQDDDDDYDPEAMSSSANAGADAAQAGELLPQPALELGPFELPKPPPLSEAELAILSEQTIAHVFETALISERSSALPKQKLGINRLAGSTNDKESWLTLMIRLATRAPAGLDAIVDSQLNGSAEHIKSEPYSSTALQAMNVANRIRRLLFDYVLDDWKHRLSLGITWLTEEWYADKVQIVGTPYGDAPTTRSDGKTPNYDFWTAQLFEALIPRFDKDDQRILIRFLSELPSLNQNILTQVKALTRDPATVAICQRALQYLYLMRPPVRETVIDTMEEIWREGDNDIKASTGQLLQKWRPGFAERATGQTPKAEEDTRTFPNGVTVEDAAVKQTDGSIVQALKA